MAITYLDVFGRLAKLTARTGEVARTAGILQRVSPTVEAQVALNWARALCGAYSEDALGQLLRAGPSNEHFMGIDEGSLFRISQGRGWDASRAPTALGPRQFGDDDLTPDYDSPIDFLYVSRSLGDLQQSTSVVGGAVRLAGQLSKLEMALRGTSQKVAAGRFPSDDSICFGRCEGSFLMGVIPQGKIQELYYALGALLLGRDLAAEGPMAPDRLLVGSEAQHGPTVVPNPELEAYAGAVSVFFDIPLKAPSFNEARRLQYRGPVSLNGRLDEDLTREDFDALWGSRYDYGFVGHPAAGQVSDRKPWLRRAEEVWDRLADGLNVSAFEVHRPDGIPFVQDGFDPMRAAAIPSPK